MKRRIIAMLMAVSMLVFATGCTRETPAELPPDWVEPEDNVTTSDDFVDGESDDYVGDESDSQIIEEKDWYTLMLEASIQTTGNNYRLKKVLERARSGETVNVCTLGGSITEGGGATSMDHGYAYNFEKAFKETYCTGDNLNFVNAGLSGTPSSLGVMRYDRDVVEALGGAPDLLIIEFAVNDWQEATGGRALESLIYRALSDNDECAVIVLYSVTNKMWNLQSDMMPYGNYYSVPMVSMLDALKSTTEINLDLYYSDEFHPKNYGHTVMSDCLMKLLEIVDASEMDDPVAVPEEAKKGREFADMKLIYRDTVGVKLELGAFSATDKAVQSCFFTNSLSFPDNFMKENDNGGALKLTLTCSTLLLDFKTANDSSFGTAEVYVDGELVKTLEGYSAGGWNNGNVVLIIDEAEAKEHEVVVKMAAGHEDKKFTVLAFAYN